MMNAPRSVLKTRITPTPSGFLHLGNALNFVYVWLMARSYHAKILLRIDDLDADRVRPEYLDDIFRTLDWLGLDYDEGPTGPDELQQIYSQRLKVDRYKQLIDDLGDDVFLCTCTRKQILEVSPNGLYPGTCRDLNLDPQIVDSYAYRLKTPQGSLINWNDLKQGHQRIDLYRSMRDFVVLRKDGIPAYQIASLADDKDTGVNLVVRGEDLIASTAAQLYMAQQLQYDSFTSALFLHHPLLRDAKGKKLSKSAGALSIQELRKTSSRPGQVLTQIGQMLGCPHDFQVENIQDLLLFMNEKQVLESLPA